MTMHTERYCPRLESLDPVKAIRAIHEAHLQLSAVNSGRYEPGLLDNAPALESLCGILASVGHPGYGGAA